MTGGIAASLVASCLFGGIYFLSPLLAPLSGEQVYGWRMLSVFPFTTAWLVYSGQWAAVRQIAARAAVHRPLMLALLASSALVAVQLWLFVWAPLHGHALPVSLGYFLMPLVMVLMGRVLYGERLTPLQTGAAVLAALGVGWELLRAGTMAWSTWAVAIGYPCYFVLRRRLGTDSLAGHWLDVALMLPACLWCIFSPVPPVLAHAQESGQQIAQLATVTGWQMLAQSPRLTGLMALMGLCSAVALALYMVAHQRLPLGLFGLLSYMEPVLLAVVALLLGERIQPGQAPMYTLIAAAVLLLAVEGGLKLRQGLRQRV